MTYQADDDNDVFAALGGSLMNDLLKDLQVGDEGDDAALLSLEQLERELAHLDKTDPPSGVGMAAAPPPATAASLVVQHAQTVQQHHQTQPYDIRSPATQQDAWSLNMQNFTSQSLDFLQADSARKQQVTKKPPGFLSSAEDYDVSEPVVKATAPPGIRSAAPIPPSGSQLDASSQVLAGAAAKLVQQLQSASPSMTEAPEHQDSFSASPPNLRSIPKPAPMTPQNSITLSSSGSLHASSEHSQRKFIPPTPPPSAMPTPRIDSARPVRTVEQGGQMPLPALGMTSPHEQQMMMRHSEQPMPPQGVPPPPMQVPVALPLPRTGPAWQQGPVVPAQQPVVQPVQAPRYFCHPYPGAPPIPATALTSRYMKSRDITYVVHGILRPILAAGTSVDDYDVQYWMRRGGGSGPRKSETEKARWEKQIDSRLAKSKDWSNKKGVLGHVAKTNVARPRALIAQPVSSEQDIEQKQRAAVWKARIVCDQAYQAFQLVVTIWREAPPGQVPAAVQSPLVKLMKCMGIQATTASSGVESTEYNVDADKVQLMLRLGKGRVLVSRVLEQALLPPKAVNAVLPCLMELLCAKQAPDSSGPMDPSKLALIMEDDRIFRALERVIQKLPQLSGPTIIQTVQALRGHGKTALSSTTRMQCVHALVYRGGALAAEPSNGEFTQQWKPVEADFVNVLSGL